ncbi:MAG: chorismate-binding protein, partial [Pseudomonadales bacterium]|nr:chorismate-binding protein [Pseudomonadales bacterium]
DRRLRLELQNSAKDKAENLMIVDLLRNDLGRICETGSVTVDALFEAVSFANVHHLISTVSGRLKQQSDIFELFKACFPGGSITGAPKVRAMEIIQELEKHSRSVYCGSIASLSYDGQMDSNICIRTLVCNNGKVHCWGGGGIVADSNGAAEYQETFDKISLFINGLNNKSDDHK